LAKDIVCIDIGTLKTKIVYGHIKSNSLLVKAYSIFSNSEKCFDYDGNLNIKEFFTLLMIHLKKMKIKRKKIALVLPNAKAVVRTRELPKVKLKELTEMVKFEAEQFLPYNADEFMIDYRVIETELSNDENLLNVLIIALPKDIVMQHLEVLEKTKNKIVMFSPYTDAIYKYASRYLIGEKKNILIADIGENHLKMIVFHEGNYFASINAETGIKNLVETFSENNQIDLEKSRNILFGKIEFKPKRNLKEQIAESDSNNNLENKLSSLSSALKKVKESNDSEDIEIKEKTSEIPSRVDLSKLDKIRMQFEDVGSKNEESTLVGEKYFSINEVYYEIYKEINRMVDFYRTRRFGTNIDEIILCGGGANLINIKDYLYDNFIINVKTISEKRKDNLSINEKDFNLLISSIGAGLI